MQIFKDVGLLDNSHQFAISSWEELLTKSLSNVTSISLRSTDSASVRSAISDLMGPNAEFARRVLSEINLFREAAALSSANLLPLPLPPPPGSHQQTAIEHFAQLLSAQLSYSADERDMVVLSHEIVSRPKHLASTTATTQDEMVYTSSLMVTGTPSNGQSAMSRTVGLPLAFATQEVLDGRVDGNGVMGGKEVWRAVLGGMASVGVHMRESFSSLRNERMQTVEGQLILSRSQL
jgi:alpha-aminoadipic semialdehyde synthase